MRDEAPFQQENGMRLLLATAVAVPLMCSAPTTVAAQSFLENFARRAADRVATAATERVTSAAESVISGEDGSANEGPEAAAPRRAASPSPAAVPSGPTPWPLNPADATYTGDLEFAPADEARVRGLHEFSRVRCMDCEGGYSFDSWITHHTDMDGEGVGGLVVGQSLSWTGIEASGRLEIVSESPVGPFACKPARMVMTGGEQTYAAPRLYCFGKSHQFAREMWVEVL